MMIKLHGTAQHHTTPHHTNGTLCVRNPYSQTPNSKLEEHFIFHSKLLHNGIFSLQIFMSIYVDGVRDYVYISIKYELFTTIWKWMKLWLGFFLSLLILVFYCFNGIRSWLKFPMCSFCVRGLQAHTQREREENLFCWKYYKRQRSFFFMFHLLCLFYERFFVCRFHFYSSWFFILFHRKNQPIFLMNYVLFIWMLRRIHKKISFSAKCTIAMYDAEVFIFSSF